MQGAASCSTGSSRSSAALRTNGRNVRFGAVASLQIEVCTTPAAFSNECELDWTLGAKRAVLSAKDTQILAVSARVSGLCSVATAIVPLRPSRGDTYATCCH